ncbi:fimbria/pilus periplasmic chaperone [Enterobacteriaceae bacterium RIT691]|nr:fimbria/pilus periplasmic chaperone [Enterobacteriaceae bacterium RIT691]
MKGFITVVLAAMVLPAQAGVVIYGTRVIYPAEKKEVIVQLMNQGQRTSLVQSWIDDGNTELPPEKINVPFLLTPPVAKVVGRSGQQLKIKKMPNALPENKESLFYLNVLDIPPNNPEHEGKNALKFAMQSRIKIFYRPKGILPVNNDSFHKLSFVQSGKGLVIKNDTDNWITVTTIKLNSVRVNDASIMVPPRASQTVALKNNVARTYNMTIIDDYGNYLSNNVDVK